MKKLMFLSVLLLSGCASSELNKTFNCTLPPYSVELKIERHSLKDAVETADVVGKRLNLKDYDIVCEQEMDGK